MPDTRILLYSIHWDIVCVCFCLVSGSGCSLSLPSTKIIALAHNFLSQMDVFARFNLVFDYLLENIITKYKSQFSSEKVDLLQL